MLGAIFERILRFAAKASGLEDQLKTLELLEVRILEGELASVESEQKSPKRGRDSREEAADGALHSQDFFTRLKRACGGNLDLSEEEAHTLQSLFGAGHGFLRHHDFVQGLRTFCTSHAFENFTRKIRTLVQHAARQKVDIRLHFQKYDPSGKGSISAQDFEVALKGLGIDAGPQEISMLMTSYADHADASRVSYVLFLDDMASTDGESSTQNSSAEPGGTGKSKRMKEFSAASVDIVVRLREFAREYTAQTPDGYRELWFQMETSDEHLRGWISPEQLVQAFKTVGYTLVPIDLRRLQSRFALQDDMQECIRYRDLLVEILAPTRPNEPTPRDRLKDDDAAPPESGRMRLGLQALEYLTRSELTSILSRLDAVSCAPVDVRDVFEQYDKFLSGRMRFADFMQCMEWLGFISPSTEGQDNVHERSLVRRLANHLQTTDQDEVAYRELFVLLEGYRQSPSRAQATRVAPHERELLKLVTALKEKARLLRLSNVSLAECFAAFDTDRSGTLTHREFHSALLQLGVQVAIVGLPRALASFEAEIDRLAAPSQEIGVHYRAFVDMINESLDQEDAMPPGLLWDDDRVDAPSEADPVLEPQLLTRCKSVHLKDRFEFVKLLRQYISDSAGERTTSAGFARTLRACFDDLDVAQDGAIQLEDIVEASTLLGYPVSKAEAARVVDFPFLFYKRTLKPGGAPLSVEPRSPEDLARDALQAPRALELTFDTFCLLVDPMFPRRREQAAQADISSHSEAWKALFCAKEETHYSLGETIQALQGHIAALEAGSGPCRILDAFEMRDKALSDRVPIDDLQSVLANCLQLEFTPREVRRLARRVGIISPPSSRATAKSVELEPELEVFIFYRPFVRAIAPDEFAVEFTWDDEVVLDRLRGTYVDGQPLHLRLGQVEVSRAAVAKVLAQALKTSNRGPPAGGPRSNQQDEDEEDADAETVSVVRILRKFADPEGNAVDVVSLSRLLHLELAPSKERKLRQLLDGTDSEEFRSQLERFEAEDRTFQGALETQIFKRCARELFRHVQLDEVEVDGICERFRINIDGNVPAVDYRAVLRYFTSGSQTWQQAEVGEAAAKQALPLSELIRLSKRSGSVWKYIWETEDIRHENPRTKSKQLSFAQWKVRKDLWQDALETMNAAEGDLACEDGHWRRAGLALAATDLLVRVRCAKPVGKSLEHAFVAWSKRGRAFPDGLAFSADAGPGNESNKTFVRRCREAWVMCEREVRSNLLVARMEHVKQQEAREAAAEDSEEEDAAGPETVLGRDASRKTTREFFSVKQFLQRSGPEELKAWVKNTKAIAERRKLQEEKETLKERQATHEHFVRRKHQLRVRLPREEQKKGPARDLDPELKILLERSHHQYMHATSFMDLERCRKAVVHSGFIFSENFVDPEGYLDEQVFENLRDTRAELRRDKAEARRQGADHQFTLWLERKNARAQAESFLRAIDQPSIAAGCAVDRDALWRDVGRALKAVDAKGLLSTYIEWSAGFAGRAKCAAAWSQYPPRTFASTSSAGWEWVHLRSVLVKLLAHPRADLAGAFQDVVAPSERRSTAFYQKMLIKCPADRFRQVLAKAGVQLRLHEEKRLMSSFPGRDEEGEPVLGTVNMSLLLQVASRHIVPSNPPPGAEVWTRPKTGTLLHGREYELSLEERVQLALVVAGAPSEIAMDWREQRAELQRSLVFLSVVSRQNRVDKACRVQERAQAVPPGTPELSRITELSSSTSITLGYKIEDDGNPDVSFFCLERVHKGKFTTLWQDPPTLTQPPTIPEGRFIVADLVPNAMYTFRLTAFNENGASRSIRRSFWTSPPTPPKPTASSCTYEGQLARFTLSWAGSFSSPRTSCIPVAAISSNLKKRSLAKDKATDKGGVSAAEAAGSCYEVLARDLTVVGVQDFDIGVSIYRGRQTACQVVGLQPGTPYQFVVRALNEHLDASAVSDACIVMPLVPPQRPRVSIPKVTWKTYTGKPDAIAVDRNGAVGDPEETFRRWEASRATAALETLYQVQVRTDSGWSKSFETRALAWTLPRLEPNTVYSARLRVRCRLASSASSEPLSFASPWSETASFRTAPNAPTAPVLVDATADSMLVRWSTPKGGAGQYVVEIKEQIKSESTVAQSGGDAWRTAFRGKSTLARISGLKPAVTIEIRVIASDAKGSSSSEPSDSLVASTLTAAQAQAQLARPSSAKADFTIPCEKRDHLLPGDLVLFSEKSGLPCWRTIAGRLVADKGGKFWFEVQWSTVADRAKHQELVIPLGACIQRSKSEVFRFQAELGIYRKAWLDESGRRACSGNSSKTLTSDN